MHRLVDSMASAVMSVNADVLGRSPGCVHLLENGRHGPDSHVMDEEINDYAEL